MNSSSNRNAFLAIQKAALSAAEPRLAVERHVRFSGEILTIGDMDHNLSSIDRIQVLGAGKAAQPMVGALVEILGERIEGGLVIAKRGELDPSIDTGTVECVEAAHPVPDESGMEAAEQIANTAAEMGEGDLALVVIAGGASALLTLPTKGLSLEDLQATTDFLLRCGATIQELNTVRKHLSRIKGGHLARLIGPARSVSLILSDVVGDPLDGIGSGPTAPDPTTYAAAWQVLERTGLEEKIPTTVKRHLKRGLAGEIPETPKLSDPLFRSVQNTIVGSNRQAAEAAVRAAQKNGFSSKLLTTTLEGEARDVGRQAAALARDLVEQGKPIPRPACLVLGGETTVTVNGMGKGGRNQELVLSAAIGLEGLSDAFVVALATDGGDGPTDAAGAVATGDTISRARSLGLDPIGHLDNNDAYPFFDALDDLIRTGPTHTNVADLIFVYAS
ncbi:MAG: glycerate kinase [Proteobacteria bacterium]|nr:glycerate kinase [Pseudomonadota bacterium]